MTEHSIPSAAPANKGFRYTVAAHPTTYAGVTFRSRLEATWAAYFDLIGVKWEYEPFDLDGWTPDFLLHVKHGDLLAEVKPILNFSWDDPVFEKAVAYHDRYWIALLGRKPQFDHVGQVFDRPLAGDATDRIWNETLDQLAPEMNVEHIWRQATNITRWKGPRK